MSRRPCHSTRTSVADRHGEIDLVENVQRSDDVGRDQLCLVALALPVGDAGKGDEPILDLGILGSQKSSSLTSPARSLS
jgi:hypothetical protein